MVWMILFGIGILLIAFFLLLNSRNKVKNWIEIDGEVISHHITISRDSESGQERKVYCEDIKFIINNSEVVSTSQFCTAFPYPIGKRLSILYNPDDIMDIRIKSFSRIYLIPIILICMGIFLLVGAFNNV